MAAPVHDARVSPGARWWQRRRLCDVGAGGAECDTRAVRPELLGARRSRGGTTTPNRLRMARRVRWSTCKSKRAGRLPPRYVAADRKEAIAEANRVRNALKSL